MRIKRNKKTIEVLEETNKDVKKSNKKSLKKLLFVIGGIFLLATISFIGYAFCYPSDEDKLEKIGYSTNSIDYFISSKLVDKIINNSYSKTLDEAINKKLYVDKNLDYYLAIEYLDIDQFIETINDLASKGYSVKEVKTIIKLENTDINTIRDMEYNSHLFEVIDTYYENNKNVIELFKAFTDKGYSNVEISDILKLSNERINTIINSDKVDNLMGYFDIDYFKDDNFNRYLSYYNRNKSLSIENIITRVNAGLDNSFYTNTKEVNNPGDLLVLVNKYNSLPGNYTPSDLERIDYKYNPWGLLLRHDARVAFEKMCEAASKENLYVLASSTYRSYNSQLSIYNNYVNRDGRANADRYSARAGFSEHQTGLAVDVKSSSTEYTKFEYTKEFTWMKNNSYKYGFILRYPEGKEHITGYMYESWHYRYVGVDVATSVFNNNITYDEYQARLK